ncbi:choice-of-anchor P family protein [Pseudofrankia sp. EUN1h]|uniref:choice-of-anchor P family protein n=2 Tax=Pseudofrankia TaxID=2994363 RepID=UPI000234B81B|nr:choice-of-anchor P family protein [Pseudofrankia sp. EUN1h]OHV36138.1 hypothetical protein BCD49_21080 [Pseudofrankia sp. EUN1h]
MKLMPRRAGRCAGILAIAAGVAFAAASPASAASPNRADAVRLSGIVDHGPVVESTYPGDSWNDATSISVPSLLTAGPVATVAISTAASATVSGLSLALTTAAALNADSLYSGCAYDVGSGVVSGTAQIGSGQITTPGAPIALATNPAPNTVISIPAVGTLTLNRQREAPDGTLTIDAVAASLFGGLETVTIATSVCNADTLT